MAWCHQVTSQYLNQCWPRSLSPYDITRPPWVNHLTVSYGDRRHTLLHMAVTFGPWLMPILCIYRHYPMSYLFRPHRKWDLYGPADLLNELKIDQMTSTHSWIHGSNRSSWGTGELEFLIYIGVNLLEEPWKYICIIFYVLTVMVQVVRIISYGGLGLLLNKCWGLLPVAVKSWILSQ